LSVKPAPIAPPEFGAPADGTRPQVMAYLHCSDRQFYRLCAMHEISSYLLGGVRVATWASVEAYRQRCIAKGSQLNVRRGTGRKPGRPRKHPEDDAHVAAE
jgi:hypothetical protein